MPYHLHLDITFMDENHDGFLELLTKIKSCPKEEFLPLFEQMIKHTKEHFKTEEDMMLLHSFYGLQEHRDEHDALLKEMQYFYQKAQKFSSFGKNYINNYAYEKFSRHIANIDSQLAMFLKKQT